jgi:hypothetical protein
MDGIGPLAAPDRRLVVQPLGEGEGLGPVPGQRSQEGLMAIPLVASWSSRGEIPHHRVPALVMEMLEQQQVADLARGPCLQVHIAFHRGGESMISSMPVLAGEGRAVQLDGVFAQHVC